MTGSFPIRRFVSEMSCFFRRDSALCIRVVSLTRTPSRNFDAQDFIGRVVALPLLTSPGSVLAKLLARQKSRAGAAARQQARDRPPASRPARGPPYTLPFPSPAPAAHPPARPSPRRRGTPCRGPSRGGDGGAGGRRKRESGSRASHSPHQHARVRPPSSTPARGRPPNSRHSSRPCPPRPPGTVPANLRPALLHPLPSVRPCARLIFACAGACAGACVHG
jgi:hypothetical protein